MPGSPRCAATARCASPMSPLRDPFRRARGSRCIRCSPPRSPRTSTNTAAGSPTPRSSCRTTACRSAGDKFVQTDLARTLQFMADQDRAAGAGPRSRPAGRARCVLSRRHRARDRRVPAAARAATVDAGPGRVPFRIEPVVRRNWRGHEVITCGPWCQGPALQQALALVEQRRHRRPGAQLGRLSAPHRRMPEPGDGGSRVFLRRSGVRRCAGGSSARSRRPSPAARRGARRSRVRQMPAPLDRPTCRTWRAAADLPKVEADTSYCCVVDRWGNAFSATPSDGSGNVPVVPGLGITPSGARLAEPARSAASGRRGAGQAAAADAQSGDGVTKAAA